MCKPVALLGALLIALTGLEAGAQSIDLALSAESFSPGADLTVEFSINPSATPLTALGLRVTAPEGFTYVSSAGSGGIDPGVRPSAGDSGVLEFAWFAVPTSFPFLFTVTLRAPAEISEDAVLTAIALARAGGPQFDSALEQITLVQIDASFMLELNSEPYTPGEVLDLEITLTPSIAMLDELRLSLTVPQGWEYLASIGEDGGNANIRPTVGSSGELDYEWTTLPDEFPYTFIVSLRVPAQVTGSPTISALAEARSGGLSLASEEVEWTLVAMEDKGCGACGAGEAIGGAGDLLALLLTALFLGVWRRRQPGAQG